MAIFNFNDLSKQSKIGYNALYNVVFAHSTSFNSKNGLNKFTVPLCLNADNKVCLTEKNFIFFDSVLTELKLFGFYNVVRYCGRAVDEVKTDYATVEVVLSKDMKAIENAITPIRSSNNWTTFDFSDVDTSKLLKRNGKEEKAKTEENKAKTEEEKKTVEETNKALEAKTEEVEQLKKEVAKKEEQLNKKAIAEFNDGALFDIVECVEILVKKHIPMLPKDFDFTAFEADLMNVAGSQWDKKLIK
jgi:hypothetical protein